MRNQHDDTDPLLSPDIGDETFDASLYHAEAGYEVETTAKLKGRAIRTQLKREALALLKGEELRSAVKGIPAAGVSLHVVANGDYDYWTWIPTIIDWLGGIVRQLYISTWTANGPNVRELLRLIDQGKIGRCAVLTGLYFKRRETAVYAQLITGLEARGQRYRAFRNHAKVSLLTNGADWITVEGSANLTANPRLEQYVITNDRKLYDFHAAWMEAMLIAEPEKDYEG